MIVPVIQLGRRQGKTETLIEWFLLDPDHRVIITADVVRAEHITKRLADKTDTTASQWKRHVLPWASRDTLHGRRVEVVIDQADHILQWMFAGQLKGVTWDA